MIYNDKTKRALKLCYKAHEGQFDKSGLPYVFHPLHLAEQMQDENSIIVALLHDVVEDTEYSLSQIRGMDFGSDVLAALELLSHDKEVPYMDYIKAIAECPLARRVKLADLRHNSDLSRLNHKPTEEDEKRVEKYHSAIEFLERDSETIGKAIIQDFFENLGFYEDQTGSTVAVWIADLELKLVKLLAEDGELYAYEFTKTQSEDVHIVSEDPLTLDIGGEGSVCFTDYYPKTEEPEEAAMNGMAEDLFKKSRTAPMRNIVIQGDLWK